VATKFCNACKKRSSRIWAVTIVTRCIRVAVRQTCYSPLAFEENDIRADVCFIDLEQRARIGSTATR
jgi:hypothetical protein